MLLFNFHTTAGGTLQHPESEHSNRIRALQIGQLLSRANRESHAAVIIAEDLNAGLGVPENNYLLFQSSGFVSIHDCLHQTTLDATWGSAQHAKSKWAAPYSPPQRVDHVFIREDDFASGKIRLLSSEIKSREEVVVVSRERRVTLSDRYSVRVSVRGRIYNLRGSLFSFS